MPVTMRAKRRGSSRKSRGYSAIVQNSRERMGKCRARTVSRSSGLSEHLFHPQFDNIRWSIASTGCGEIPSSPNPGISGDDTVSICISST
jgi:hypothetical protein